MEKTTKLTNFVVTTALILHQLARYMPCRQRQIIAISITLQYHKQLYNIIKDIMLKKILSISGKPGLFRLVNRGKNMLIVENLATGRRTPAYASDKVVSLGDISIYTTADEDAPLYDVLEKVKEANNGEQIDVKALGDDAAVRAYFKTILPDFDEDRVYTTDIRKLFSWYNQLVAAGVKDFKEKELAQDQAAEAAEKADEAQTAK